MDKPNGRLSFPYKYSCVCVCVSIYTYILVSVLTYLLSESCTTPRVIRQQNMVMFPGGFETKNDCAGARASRNLPDGPNVFTKPLPNDYLFWLHYSDFQGSCNTTPFLWPIISCSLPAYHNFLFSEEACLWRLWMPSGMEMQRQTGLDAPLPVSTKSSLRSSWVGFRAAILLPLRP
jgi:hypothetical protein